MKLTKCTSMIWLIFFVSMPVIANSSERGLVDNSADLLVNYSSVVKDNIGGENATTIDEAARGYRIRGQHQLWFNDLKPQIFQFGFSMMPVARIDFAENNFATVDEFDFDYRRLSIAGGVRFDLADPIPFLGAISITPWASFERLEQGNDGVQNGYSMAVESRVLVRQWLELGAELTYYDLTLQNGFEIEGTAAVTITDSIVLVGSAGLVQLTSPSNTDPSTDEGDFDATNFGLGLRVSW